MLPPNVAQAKPNSGPALAPQAQPGNAAAAMQQVKSGATLLNKAIGSVPMGTEFHTKLLKILTDLNKLMSETPDNPGMQATALMGQARQTAQTAPMQALQKLYPQAQPPGAGGQPPPPAAAA
jgi:hypothetical protein